MKAKRLLPLAALLALATKAGTAAEPNAAAATTAPTPSVGVKALLPAQLAWQPMRAFSDGRERVDLVGDAAKGGSWIYRVRVPKPIEVMPHTHPVDEYVTVLEGTWLLGSGTTFRKEDLVAYPPGSFVVIPAGTPHFVATGVGPVVIQSSGEGVFATRFIEHAERR